MYVIILIKTIIYIKMQINIVYVKGTEHCHEYYNNECI